MSDAPHDAESLIRWFTATEIVRHDGSRSPRDPYMTEREARFLASRIGKTSHYGQKEYRERNPWSAETIWSVALNQNLFMGRQFGWIDRAGSFYRCGHAAHELLLHFLGVDIREVELGGWIRVSMSGLQSIYTPSDAQVRTLVLRGLEDRARILMYEGIEPRRIDVKAATVKEPEQ